MIKALERQASNGEYVLASELDVLATAVYKVMGFEPKRFSVDVWPEREPSLNDTLAEAAPLHQEFHDSWEDAKSRLEQIFKEIEAGTFAYNPPMLPDETVTDDAVKFETVGDYRVSTVGLSLLPKMYNKGDAEYETAVFRAYDNMVVHTERSVTREGAEAVHDAIVLDILANEFKGNGKGWGDF